MASGYASLKTAIQAVADAAGGALQVSLGTTGSTLSMPEDEDPNDPVGSIPLATGQCWDDKNPLKVLLNEIGNLLDSFGISWGFISTNGAGVDPTVDSGFGLGVPTKDEVFNRLSVFLDPVYADARMFFTASVLGTFWTCAVGGYDVDHATFTFYDKSGVQQTINSRTVLVLFAGRRV